MYNEQIKSQFVRDCVRSNETMKNYATVFALSELFENKFQKDLCQMDVDELSETIESMCNTSRTTMWNRLCLIRSYVRWCIATNVPGAKRSIENVRITGIEAARKNMVGNPLELQTHLDAIYCKESDGNIDNIYRCFVWMSYVGMGIEDILNLEPSNIDILNKAVVYKGKSYRLCEESLPCVEQCMERVSFVSKHRLHKDREEKRIDGTLLLRGTKSMLTVESARNMLSRHTTQAIKSGSVVKRLSHREVWDSGLFYRLYKGEIEGITIDFEEVFDFKEEVFGRNPNGVTGSVRDQSIRLLKSNYEKWKIAFHL